MAAVASSPARVLGRYTLYDPIASGGMATVHFGRLLGPVGFARTVAIKRLHPQFASSPEFVSMFLDEARLAARIRHPNVVPTLDVVAMEGELFLVMEYVQGEPLGALLNATARSGKPMPPPYAVAIIAGALRGLHAAHDATDEMGNALGIVHRDISPQNILVGIDGVPRVLDFGVAKAAGRLQISREGQLKGKMAYMPPEQIRSAAVDRRTDIYAVGAVLWESLTSQRLFPADNDVAALAKALEGKVELPSKLAPGIPPALDAIVLKALSRSPGDRFESAREMARALEAVVPLVAVAEIGEWVEKIASEQLVTRARLVSRIESDSSTGTHPVTPLAALSRASSPDIEALIGRGTPSPPKVEVVDGEPIGVEADLGASTPDFAAANLKSAVFVTRFSPRRVLTLAGAALVLLFAIGWLATRAAAPRPVASTLTANGQAPSGTAAQVDTAASVRAVPPPAATVAPTDPVRPSGVAAAVVPTAATSASASPPTRAPADVPVPAAPNPSVAPADTSHNRAVRPPRAHPLEGVLDSRK